MPIFAGGIRIWQAPLPDNIFTAKHIESSLGWCKKKGVREVCLTAWAYAKTIYQTALLELCRWGELSYNDTSSDLASRFEFITGASYEAFVKMSCFNSVYETDEDIKNAWYDGSLFGNRFFESDILLNTMEADLIDRPLSGYFNGIADYFRTLVGKDPEWDYLYRYTLGNFDALATKCLICENLTPAYKSGDREMLRKIAEELLPRYIRNIDEIGVWHNYHKDKYLRPFGMEIMDEAYGAKKERAMTVIRRISYYLDGKLSSLPELEVPKYHYKGGPVKVKN